MATMSFIANAVLTVTLLLLLAWSQRCTASFSSQPEEKHFEIPNSGILAAFADVNADKMTDILLIDKGLKSFTVLNHFDHDGFDAKILTTSKTCYMNEEIVSLVPGDFHGNTYVDVAVISRNPASDTFNIRIAKGSGPGNSFDCSRLNETANYTSSVQPLLLDFNGDMICDLLIQNNSNRVILQGPVNKDLQFTIVDFATDDPVPIRKVHSNHFVDFNQDNVADIMIETDKHFEYWYAHPDGKYGDASDDTSKRKASKKIDRPKDIDGNAIKNYGISIFMDFDGDSFQEHLMPVNMMMNGELRAAIIMLRESDYKWSLIATNFSIPSDAPENFLFHEENYSNSLTFPLTARQGDVNSDGYPDLVSVMKSANDGSPSIIALKNVVDSAGNRTFAFMSKPAVKNPLVATFFDLLETGTLDLIYSSRSEGGNITLGSYMNVVAIESYFLKIMVASSHCPDNECVLDRGWSVKRDIVDYGSNLPGPYVWYSLQDVTGMRKNCGAGQMTSASHFSLQTPYLIMGLGEYANYIDRITITIPYLSSGTRVKRTRDEEQIVPDAQIIIVPRYEEEPRRWFFKMWISITGNQIKHTGYTLYLIFCVLLIIIMALHKKEVMEDADENKRFKQNWLDHRR